MHHSKLIQSGKQIEIFQYEYDLPPDRSSSKEKAILRVHPSLVPRKENRRRVNPKGASHRRKDNVHRLKKAFTRLLLSNFHTSSHPLLCTFTFSSICTIEVAYSQWRKFIQRLRRRYGHNFSFVCVPEYQDRGAVHFHALIWGLPQHYGDIYTKVPTNNKRRPYRYILKKRGYERTHHPIQRLWQLGYVDLRQTDGSPALAGYVAKYLVKSQYDDRTYGQKAYIASRNIERPRSLSGSQVVDLAIQALELSPEDLVFQDTFDTMYLGKCNYYKYQYQ